MYLDRGSEWEKVGLWFKHHRGGTLLCLYQFIIIIIIIRSSTSFTIIICLMSWLILPSYGMTPNDINDIKMMCRCFPRNMNPVDQVVLLLRRPQNAILIDLNLDPV